MFGLSKVVTWIIAGGVVLALLAAIWFYAVGVGKNQVENQVLKDNIEQVEVAREADEKATDTLIREFHTIDTRTIEVKEIVNEKPPATINDVSLARLERVWRQQNEASTTNNTGPEAP